MSDYVNSLKSLRKCIHSFEQVMKERDRKLSSVLVKRKSALEFQSLSDDSIIDKNNEDHHCNSVNRE